MKPEVKGLVLAAGLGTRLRPITEGRPKPLMPFFGPTLLDLSLWRCREAGLRAVAVNTHHLAEKIRNSLKEQKDWFEELHISHEPEILGTGGAIIPLKPWLKDSHLLIYNADIVSNIDLRELVDAHIKSRREATMVLLPHNKSKKTPVWVRDGRVLQIGDTHGDASEHTFTGVHILSPQFIRRLPNKGFWHIIDTYQEALKEGAAIGALVHHGIWNDLGNPKDYWEALFEYFEKQTESKNDLVGVLAVNAAMKAPMQIFLTDQGNIKAPCSFPNSWNPPNAPIGPFSFIFDTTLPKEAAASSHHCVVFSKNQFPEKFVSSASQPKIFIERHVILSG